MQKLTIYEFSDYKKFLLQWMERAPNHGRGLRKQLADAVSCQTPFITHVLSGDYHFSLEQAEACGRWLTLNESELEFFLLLVMKQRSATKSLEQLISRQISQRRSAATVLKKRLNVKGEMTPADQMTYYSNWHYAAIHIACMNPELQTVEALQKYFNLPIPQILSVLEFLTEHGLIESQRDRLRVLKSSLFIAKDSPLLGQHHSNWRLKALETFSRKKNDDLFFTSVTSLSMNDFEWLRERIAGLLEEVVERVKDSKDEKLACLNIDWFEV
jgi:uncharacterized protein (TIGR02147 family)